MKGEERESPRRVRPPSTNEASGAATTAKPPPQPASAAHVGISAPSSADSLGRSFVPPRRVCISRLKTSPRGPELHDDVVVVVEGVKGGGGGGSIEAV
jgi:hypothetical protein